MKEKDYSSIRREAEKMSVELERFQALSMQLIAGKILADYIDANKNCTGEPEYFFEEWLKIHIIKPDSDFKERAWKAFMKNLVGYRGFEKFQ